MVKHQSSDIRRQQLFAAALEVCAEKGYDAASISDIVSKAGLSKGSLYHHFKGKRELFLELLKTMMEEFKTQMLEMLEHSASMEQAIQAVIEEFSATFQAHPGMMKGMFSFYMMGMRDAAIRQTFMEYYVEMVDVGAGMIAKGIQKGEFAAELEPRQAAWMLFTAVDGIILLHTGLQQEQQGFDNAAALTKMLITAFKKGSPCAAAAAAGRKRSKP